MSAVYHFSDFYALQAQHTEAVLNYFKANPGHSVDQCATALSISYEVAYAIVAAEKLIILPSVSGEIHWNAQKKG